MAVPTRGEVGKELGKAQTRFARKPLAFFLIIPAFLIVIVLGPKLIETNYEGNMIIKQMAVTGHMSVITDPGTFLQLFSELTNYKKADTFTFSSKAKDVSGRLTDPIEVRYQDGAQGFMMGNVRFRLSTKEDLALKLHREFKSYNAVVNDMILPALRQSVLLTAARMTAESSYTGGRLEIDRIVEDQLRNGIFRTRQVVRTVKNSITGQPEERSIAEVITDKDGNEMREPSVLAEYGVQIISVVITDLEYEESVNSQIAAKRKAIQEAATAKANAERAKQDRLTAEQEGLKNVKIAQYQEEEKKIRAITKAGEKLAVAKLDRQSAVEEKRAKILRGEGEATARRLVMQADGALTLKLKTIEAVARYAAEAVANSKHPLVPSTVFGGDGRPRGSNGASDFVNILTMKAARDMAIELKTK